jgi:microcystin-dependent protein
MAETFLGQITIVSFNFAPQGYALCDGQILPISQNGALFSLLGTFYGGDGITTFALPNLQGASPVHVGTNSVSGNVVVQGQTGGEATHTLALAEMASHAHPAFGSSATASASTPAGNSWATSAVSAYSNTSNANMNPAAISSIGGSQAHDNFQPYLVVNFVIALQGIFPSRN